MLLEASFLVGSLLSLLLPVCVLIALASWYVVMVRRVPDDSSLGPADPADPAAIATAKAERVGSED